MADVFYVMVDRPAVKIEGKRKTRFTNKPRHEHKTLESARTEALRLATLTRSRALVLRVEDVISVPSEGGDAA